MLPSLNYSQLLPSWTLYMQTMVLRQEEQHLHPVALLRREGPHQVWYANHQHPTCASQAHSQRLSSHPAKERKKDDQALCLIGSTLHLRNTNLVYLASPSALPSTTLSNQETRMLCLHRTRTPLSSPPQSRDATPLACPTCQPTLRSTTSS